MKPMGVIAIAAVGAVLAYHSAVALHQHLYGEAPPPPEAKPAPQVQSSPLTVPAEELDLGRVYETKALERRFHITNTGDVPITLHRFETSCDCLGVTPTSGVVLAPHETKPFTARLSLQAKDASAQKMDGEEHHAEITAVSSEHSESSEKTMRTSWRLRCFVVPAIRMTPSIVRFGVRSHLEQPFEKVVEIHTANEVERLAYESSADWTIAISRGAAQPSTNVFRAVIRANDTKSPRQVRDVIRLIPITVSGSRLPETELSIEGAIVHDIKGSPQEMRFGRRLCGTASEEVIRLLSLTNRRIRVIRAETSGEGLTVSSLSGDDNTFSLRQAFLDLGDRQARATFTVIDESGNESQVVVPVGYYGVANP